MAKPIGDRRVELDGEPTSLRDALVTLNRTGGIDPVGAFLRKLKLPLWDRLQLLDEAASAEDVFRNLGARLEIRDFKVFTPEDPKVTRWARATLQRYLGLTGKAAQPQQWRRLMGAVFAALQAGGVKVKPGWLRLLPVIPWQPYLGLLVQVCEDVPEPQRGELLVNGLKHEFSSSIVEVGLKLLRRFPSGPLTALVLAHAGKVDRLPKRETMATLAALAKRHPEVRAVLEAQAPAGPALHLKVASSLRPATLGELTALQRRQLAAAGQRYDGRKLPAAKRLDPTEPEREDGEQRSFAGTLQIRELSDERGPAYTAFTYMVDSGTIFKAGGTQMVAQIIQFGLECADERLKEALQPVLLDAKPARKRKPEPKKKPRKK